MNKLFIGFALTPEERARLVDGVGRAVELVESNGDHAAAGLRQRFEGCEASFGRCPLPWIADSPSLRWIQLDSVGFDDLAKLDWPTLGRRVTVTNLAGFFADPVAESALAGVLALLRGIDRLALLQSRKSWQKLELRPTLRTLRGASVLLVGRGSIGRRFEALIAPFGCRVTATTARHPLPPVELDRALASADVVFSSLPETTATRNFFDATRLALLKPRAIFVNVGRGGVVDETALAAALQARRLGGAVLDVTVVEPLPPESPLWTCPNVILTQHTGGGTEDEGMRKVEAFLDNFHRFTAGRPLAGVVDFARGY